MKKCDLKGSIDSIETLGLVDGPGIRTVVFLNGCKLRCLYCHNPEMWKIKDYNMTVDELVNKILRYKPYYKDNGGVTFSGGEPLLQSDYLLEVCKRLKKEKINIALDTAGVGNYNEKLLDYIDLIIFDIKAVKSDDYNYITGYKIDESLKFLNKCQEKNIKMWIRQVIVQKINDNEKNILELKKLKYKSNKLLEKNSKNNLIKNSLVKCDAIYVVKEDSIVGKIGKVDIELIEKYKQIYNNIIK